MSLRVPPGQVAPAGANHLSQSAARAHPTNDFIRLWNDAKDRYQSDTGHSLDEAPFAAELRGCDSVEDLTQILGKRNETFKVYRAHGKEFRAVLDPVVRVLQLFLETGGEIAASVCDPAPVFLAIQPFIEVFEQTAVPGGKGVFVAFGGLA